MTYIEEYSYTGRHQIQLMIDGLKQARKAALDRKDRKRVAQLMARIEAAEAVQTSLFNRLDESHRKYGGSEMAVVAALEGNHTSIESTSVRVKADGAQQAHPDEPPVHLNMP